jgi:hypothetical protein
MSEAGEYTRYRHGLDMGPLPSLVIPCKAKEVKAPETRWPGDTKYTYKNYPSRGQSGRCYCKLNNFNKNSRVQCNRQFKLAANIKMCSL